MLVNIDTKYMKEDQQENITIFCLLLYSWITHIFNLLSTVLLVTEIHFTVRKTTVLSKDTVCILISLHDSLGILTPLPLEHATDESLHSLTYVVKTNLDSLKICLPLSKNESWAQ